MRSTPSNYGKIAQTFHWISALLILFMLPLGLIMGRLHEGSIQNMLYRVHIAVGLIVFVITAARVVWRFMEPTPNPPVQLGIERKWLFKIIHLLQYLVLIGMTVTGIAMLWSSGIGFSLFSIDAHDIVHGTPATWHARLSKVFIGLLLAHFMGVFEYQLLKGNILARMGIVLPGHSQN